MAFCTSCGAQMDASASVCPSCGKAHGGATAPAPAKTAAAAPPPQKSGSALRVILLILGGFVLLGIVVVGAAAMFMFRLAKDTRVEQTSQGAKVETPYGTIEANNEDSAQLAAKMGVEVYPGAKPLRPGARVSQGGMHTVHVIFESDDPPEKIEDFYRKQFPNATVSLQHYEGGTRTALMVGNRAKWTIIAIEGHEGGSTIVIGSANGGEK